MDIKRDILGRELHDNDLVVIKGSGGYESAAKPMEVGVFMGKSVRTMTAVRTARDMFLIENPGSMELSLKNAILKKIDEEKAAAQAKKQKKNKQSANVVGRFYYMTQNREVFLYCGKKAVTIYKNGAVFYQEVGHLYLPAERWIKDDSHVGGLTFDDVMAYTKQYVSSYGGYSNITALKNFKKYEREYHTVQIPDSFKIFAVNTWKEGSGASFATTQWIVHNDEYEVVIESA